MLHPPALPLHISPYTAKMLMNVCPTCCGSCQSSMKTAMQVHLFDIDIPGKITFKESETLTQGESFTVVDTPACRMGIGICYDLRFPELAMVYAQRGVQLIVYPGAQPWITAHIQCTWACARVTMAPAMSY